MVILGITMALVAVVALKKHNNAPFKGCRNWQQVIPRSEQKAMRTQFNLARRLERVARKHPAVRRTGRFVITSSTGWNGGHRLEICYVYGGLDTVVHRLAVGVNWKEPHAKRISLYSRQGSWHDGKRLHLECSFQEVESAIEEIGWWMQTRTM